MGLQLGDNESKETTSTQDNNWSIQNKAMIVATVKKS